MRCLVKVEEYISKLAQKVLLLNSLEVLDWLILERGDFVKGNDLLVLLGIVVIAMMFFKKED